MSAIPQEITDRVRFIEEIVLSQLTLIGKQNQAICTYEKKIEEMEKQLKQLRQRFDEENEDQDKSSTDSVMDVTNSLSDTSRSVEKRFYTKCRGRHRSKHASRSLRKKLFVRDKSASLKSPVSFSSSKTSVSPLKVITDVDKTVETNNVKIKESDPVPPKTIIMNSKEPNRKCRRVKQEIKCFKTEKPYYVPDYYGANSLLSNAETTIDVPSWRHLTVPRFYNLDLPENIDDSVFQKRHSKPETEERRRKKHDLEQQKQHQCMHKNVRYKLCKKPISLYPQLHDIEYIEITESLPVVAFGHLIPVFQPNEFSLPWLISDPAETAECSKRMRMFLTSN